MSVFSFDLTVREAGSGAIQPFSRFFEESYTTVTRHLPWATASSQTDEAVNFGDVATADALLIWSSQNITFKITPSGGSASSAIALDAKKLFLITGSNITALSLTTTTAANSYIILGGA